MLKERELLLSMTHGIQRSAVDNRQASGTICDVICDTRILLRVPPHARPPIGNETESVGVLTNRFGGPIRD